MSWMAALRGTAAALVAVVAVAGCDRNVGGAAHPTTDIPPGSSSPGVPAAPSLTTILPDADQWFAILGGQPELSPLTVSGSEALGRQDAIGDWSQRDCLGVVIVGLESVFTAAPVTAVLDGYPVFQTRVAVIAYHDQATAAALFGPMSDRWRQCGGKTVVDSSTTPPFTTVIGDIHTAPTVASTTLTVLGDHPQTSARALAQAGRCLIDVAVPLPAGPGLVTPDDAATRAATAMQDKAAAAGC